MEGIDPFGMLPDEVLEVILDRLCCPADLASCSEAHTKFAKILKPTKSTWFFHKIFHLIANHLSWSELLKYRLVCRQWKLAVDTFLENRPIPIEKSSPHVQSLSNWYFWPKTSSRIIEFLDDMTRHPRSSFVTQRLRLGKDFDSVPHMEQLNDDYWSNVQILLSRFGDQVVACRLTFEETPVNLTYILRGCLNRLPNLKSLSISNVDLFGGSNRRRNGLIQSLQENPLPSLPLLEHLAVVNVPLLFFELVLPSYANSVKVFEFGQAQLSNLACQADSNGSLHSMHNLESISISINHEHLLMFPSATPNLTRLVISCPQVLNGRTLGKLLQLCQNSLEEFVIIQEFRLGDRVGDKFTESFPDVMPNLKVIQIVNPSQDWVANVLGRTHQKLGFHYNVEKLKVQWRTRQLECPSPKLKPGALPLSLNEMRGCGSWNENWAQINEFLVQVMSVQNFWKVMLPNLQSCSFSGHSEGLEVDTCIFSGLVRRRDVTSIGCE